MPFRKKIDRVLKKKKSLRAIRISAALFFLSMIFFGTSAAFVESEKIVIYFYSSEANINNFKSLKVGFDTYLSEYGPYELQPFADRETFEKHIKDKDKCLLLLSSWHYRKIHREYGLESMLAGTRGGEKYQKRILVAKGEIADIESVKVGRIASSSSAQHTKSVLRTIFKEKNAADKTRILTVPKDIDALMSVGFGMTKAALTTRNAFEELKVVNPILYKKLNTLAEGQESLLLILAVPEGFTKQAEKMVKVIKNMPGNPDGKKKIRMLGLDGWQELDPSDKSRLEAK